ncbi:hypothetical protein [Nonomuraea diastatica]|uniref:hypothetical protein n=1 Tax=Nonomuraea diastatica TaxID=1848329 RepID=UPI001407AE2B|nr:hypothetical protein [Nonomuraea diastatica]
MHLTTPGIDAVTPSRTPGYAPGREDAMRAGTIAVNLPARPAVLATVPQGATDD